MTTQASPRGLVTDFLIKEQTTPGVVATGNYIKTPIYSHSLEETEPFENDPILGLTRNNNRDQSEPAPGLPSAAGSIDIPLDLNHIGYWLKGIFGAPVTTGSTDKTHVFKSGAEVIPHWTGETKLQANDFRQYDALFCNTISLDLSRAAGFQRAQIGALFRRELPLTATGGGTPAEMLARIPFAAAAGALKIDTGSGFALAGRLNSAQFNYDNKAKAQEYVNNKWIAGHDLDEPASAAGSFATRYANSTYYDLGKAKTLIGVQFVWELSGTLSLEIEMPNVRISPKGTPISGPAGIDVAYDWRAEQSNDDPMVTVTLKNAVTSY